MRLLIRWFRLSMAARLLIAFIALLLPLILFSAWSFQRSLDDRRDDALTEAVDTAQTMAAVVRGLLSDLDGTTLAMSLALGGQARPLSQETIGPYLSAMATQYPIVRAVFVTDAEGRVVAAQRAEGIGTDVRSRPYAQALLGGQEFVLGDVTPGIQSGSATVTMARTVRSPDGVLRGLLVVAFYPDRLAELFPGDLPADANLAVLDRRGWTVYSSANPDIPWERRDQSASPRIRDALAGEVSTTRGTVSALDGQDRLAAAVPVERYGWVVSYSRTVAAVEGPLDALFRRQLLALGVVSLGALAAALAFGQTLARPLARLAEQARAFGRGQGWTPASRAGTAEVRDLAVAFNQMAAEVDRRFAEREAAEAALREAETRYRGIFEQAIEGIFQTGFDGRLREVNPAGAQILGYDSPEEVLAIPDVVQFYADSAKLDEYLAHLRTDGEVTNFEFEARRKDGSTCWLSLNARGRRGADGRIEQVEGLFSDVSERRRAEQEREDLLARERAARAEAERAADRITRLQDITAALSEALTPEQVMDVVTAQGLGALGAYAGGVGLVTPDGMEIDVVRSAGYPPEVLAAARRYPVTADNPPAEAVRTGSPVWVESLVEEAARFPRHAAAAAAGTGSRAIAAIPLLDETGVFGALALSFSEPRRFDDDDRAFVFALARHCAQALIRARLYEAERTARSEAEAANRAKDEFLSMLSHQLRTPLTPILGWTAMLRRRSLDEDARMRGLAIIERSAQAQAQLVGDLLDVSRIVTGKLMLEPAPVDLREVVTAALVVVQPSAEAKGISLTTTLDPTAPVSGDADRLQQVIWNLLANAVKFTPEGGRVELRLRTADRQAEITVSDTGQGISPGFLPYVFDRFRQADSTSTRRYGGLGLGLAIARHLVELHGGTIAAASEGEGKGATFTVRLPLATATRATVNGRAGDADTIGMANGRGALAGLRLLVVEDEADTRDFIRLLLEGEGAGVTAAASTEEGRAAFDLTPPDLIISDIGMPGEDGYSLIAHVRAQPASLGGAIPAVALTAYAGPSDRERAAAAGFTRHLTKPVDPATLV